MPINVNDYKEYLAKGHESAKKQMGKKKGSVKAPEYGSDKGKNNEIYEERGEWSQDDKKLSRQALPDNRRSDYFGGY